MDDEGVPMGALLGEEDFFDCGGRESIGAETVDGLGGEGYGAAFAQDLRGAGYVGGAVGVQPFRCARRPLLGAAGFPVRAERIERR